MKVILASASPRRRELLAYIFDEFECIPADIDETVPKGIPAERTAEYLAVEKASFIAKTHPNDLVIGCDTIVVCDGRVYGKPADKNEAELMLKTLSGRKHTVITGVCLLLDGRKESFSESTEVEFYPLSEKEITDYINTGKPMDKAGAYGIQDKELLPVRSITGDYFNVVGLPAARLKREAESFLRQGQ